MSTIFSGHPIANDPLYGPQKVEASREALDPNAEKTTEHFDQDCPECIQPFLDPEEQQMVLWLHALVYRSNTWKYETKLPQWAKFEHS